MQRKEKSFKRIKGLIFLMVITLILGITATYAWFSTQRDVEVSGMRLNVEVAESLQISLDGEIWTQSIQIANMRQFYGTYTGTGDSFAIYQAKKPDEGGNTNYVPTELLPVSSAGEVQNGKLQFVQGTIENNADGTTKLKGITACSEVDLTATETVANRQNGNSLHPYLVFDMYLRNISAKTTGVDELLLNAGSKVWVNTDTTDDGEQEGKGVAGTGLEYSARVGMVLYGNTLSVTATDTGTQTIGEQIRGLTADGNEVAAIWEPNNKEHTTYVVSNNGRGITSTTQEVDTYGIKVAIASAATKEIANINATNDSNLVAVDTFTPAYTTVDGGVDTKTVITNTAGNNVGLAPNQISKVRIYVWLEGQDPDCIDLASTGDKLNVTLKLTKDQTTTTDKNTYVGDGTGSGNTGTGLTAATLTTEDYGGRVTNYASSTSDAQKSVNWRIFHTDGTNIYLIADDYVHSDYVPNGKGGSEIYVSEIYENVDYQVSFNNVINDYAGWEDLLSSSIATRWLSKYAASTYTSTKINMKATAYLLDTSVWNPVFVNNNYADYAIGTPTLELFAASYNAKYTDKTLVTQVSSEKGYQVKWSTDASYPDYPYYINGLNTSDNLYVISDTTKASYTWIASPAAFDESDVEGVRLVMVGGRGGDVCDIGYTVDYLGLRPCVVLKSNIQIEKQEDGTYLIVE